MKLKLNLMIVMVAMSLTGLALADAPRADQGGGARQGRGGQRGRRNNTSISALVYRADVQADLALTDDEKSKLDAMRESMRPQRIEGAAPPTPEERKRRITRKLKQF
jgi:hypothetical protein